jgi:hypothetical protein
VYLPPNTIDEEHVGRIGLVFMNSEPRRFVLQALDPDHGSPVLEALFSVNEVEDLRALLADAGDDPALERCYFLDAAELAAVNARFGTAFDPAGREVLLYPWHSIRDVPYLIHGGYELPLLLEGRKQLARFSDEYPPNLHWNEEKFDRYVAEGVLHKEIIIEPFEAPIHLKHGKVVEGLRTVYYARKGEEWRVPASKLIKDAVAKSKWNEDFERMEGMLFGYEEWQNDWWIAEFRKRRGRFGCLPVYRAVNAQELAWIEMAGYRALPPTESSTVTVSLLFEPPDDDAARRLIECSDAVALVHVSVGSLPFLALVEGQAGPTYAIAAERIKDLNRNIAGEVEIVARPDAEGNSTFNRVLDPREEPAALD